jgi:hypothetical protein
MTSIVIPSSLLQAMNIDFQALLAAYAAQTHNAALVNKRKLANSNKDKSKRGKSSAILASQIVPTLAYPSSNQSNQTNQAASRPKCEATLNDGRPCRHPMAPGNKKYCNKHANKILPQNNNSNSTTPEVCTSTSNPTNCSDINEARNYEEKQSLCDPTKLVNDLPGLNNFLRMVANSNTTAQSPILSSNNKSSNYSAHLNDFNEEQKQLTSHY